jgi:hypothetical protein
MPSQHKYPPIGFRPPAALRERLAAHAAETGRPVGAIVTAAVDAYLPGGTPPPAGELPPSGGELPPELPPAPRKKRRAAPAAAELAPQDGCSHPKARRLKTGTYCGACGMGGLT